MMRRSYEDVDPATVVVACFPDGNPYAGGQPSIWARRFIGVKVGDNADGTIRVQRTGVVDDLKRAVFLKGSMLTQAT